jgi:RTX calcium-binding nonapeptide repeat (4 copies)
MTKGIISDALILVNPQAFDYYNRTITYSPFSMTPGSPPVPILPAGYPQPSVLFTQQDGSPVQLGTNFTSIAPYQTTIDANFTNIKTFVPLTFTPGKLGSTNFSDINYGGYSQKAGVVGTGGLGFEQAYGQTNPNSYQRADIWLFEKGLLNAANTLLTLVHETGHALGLKDAYLVLSSVPQKFTIMASPPEYIVNTDNTRSVAEYQLYDVAALQYIYGAKPANTGNTLYDSSQFIENNGWTSNASRYRMRTIWDSSGTDTIDASGFTAVDAQGAVTGSAAYIDLRPGYFSSIGPGSGVLVDTNIFGNLRVKDSGAENVSIAFGAYIENATGTDKNDVLIGNIFSNTLVGGKGNDLIYTDGQSKDGETGDYRAIVKGGYNLTIENQKLNLQKTQVDIASGGDGNDTIVGGLGADTLSGDADNDFIVGGGTDATVDAQGQAIYVDHLSGGAGDDILMAGKQGNLLYIPGFTLARFNTGEGFTIAEGGTGNDTLYGGGTQSNLYGGSITAPNNGVDGIDGVDTFYLGGKSTFVKDATPEDRVYGVFGRVTGGIQQWWSEGGWAYATGLNGMFGAIDPLFGGGILGVLGTLLDVPVSASLRFGMASGNQLQLQYGYKIGVKAYIDNYQLDLTTGKATGGIVVYQQKNTSNPGEFSIQKYWQILRLAAKAANDNCILSNDEGAVLRASSCATVLRLVA